MLVAYCTREGHGRLEHLGQLSVKLLHADMDWRGWIMVFDSTDARCNVTCLDVVRWSFWHAFPAEFETWT